MIQFSEGKILREGGYKSEENLGMERKEFPFPPLFTASVGTHIEKEEEDEGSRGSKNMVIELRNLLSLSLPLWRL